MEKRKKGRDTFDTFERGESINFLADRRRTSYSIFRVYTRCEKEGKNSEAKEMNGKRETTVPRGANGVHPFDVDPVIRKLAARTTRRFIGNGSYTLLL